MSRRSLVQTVSLIGVTLLMLVLATGCSEQNTLAAEMPLTARQVVVPTRVPKRPPTPTPEPTLSPERIALGRELLVTYGCIGCHTMDNYPEARGMLGPDLSNTAAEAMDIITSEAYRASGGTATTASEYIYESIRKPSQYIATDCPLGECPDFVMPRDFSTRISDAEIQVLIDLILNEEK